MTKSIYVNVNDDWMTVAMRNPEDSDEIVSIENHTLTAVDVLKFLEKYGIICLTNEL